MNCWKLSASNKMNYLLDTNIIIRWLNDDTKLNKQAVSIISNPANTIFVSAIAIWEIRIKEALKKIYLPDNFLSVLKSESFEELPLMIEHADNIKNLPLYHKDSFDRILISQSMVENLTLLTSDKIFKKYDINCIIV